MLEENSYSVWHMLASRQYCGDEELFRRYIFQFDQMKGSSI